MANVPSPQRMTGVPASDLRTLSAYVNDFHKAAILEREMLAQSEQLFGGFTISDAETTAEVTFSVDVPDTSYIVVPVVTGITGAPAAGARNITAIAKTVSGFTIAVEAAPGAGTAVTYDWILRR